MSGDGISPHPRTRFSGRPIGEEPDGATPLEDDDLEGLIPDFVATRADLNEVEYANITKALPWAMDLARRTGPEGVLRYDFVFDLHRRMFDDVWRWAGTPRTRHLNIGVDPMQVVTQTKQAIDDAVWWHANDTFDVEERAARIHRRLVAVHPFRNGNGRCTRLIADLYLTALDRPPFTWGAAGGRIDDAGEVRRRYLAALRAADADDHEPLIAFCRS